MIIEELVEWKYLNKNLCNYFIIKEVIDSVDLNNTIEFGLLACNCCFLKMETITDGNSSKPMLIE